MIGELWWNRLVNSVRFLDDIQIAVMNQKSVVLFFDDEIPWQDIADRKQLNSGRQIRTTTAS